MHIEISEGEGFCAFCVGPLVWIQLLDFVVTWELGRYQAHSGSREDGSAKNLYRSGSNK